MEYSANDVKVAKNMQIFVYLYISMATFWTYDYICSLHAEWTFLLRSRWTKVKALYIIARYVPLSIITANLYLAMVPNEDNNKCLTLMNITTLLSLTSIACSECFFVLRTYVLWNTNKILLIVMLSALFVVVVSIIIIGFTASVTPYSTSSEIPGCHRNTDSFSFSIPFILMFVFQLVLISLTLVRVIQSWRSTNGPLYAILVKHSIFYYACGLLLSTVNILAPVLMLPLSNFLSYFLPEGFEVCILSILATRMHIHLWHMDQHADGSDIVAWISMSDMSPADRAV
ncbi:hypothetical protein BD769DRAFT_655002 [Suillus cothurnatus]|nr:hypothetical protein BD769DRAFT_655002 [Suillus cothurnatus]